MSGSKSYICGNRLNFHCPGCDKGHGVIIDGSRGWVWNKDLEKPTLSPSILVNGRAFTKRGQADFDAWHEAGCPRREDGELHQFESEPTVCHSFVTDGRIQFLNDSTHALAGQTVDLPDWDK